MERSSRFQYSPLMGMIFVFNLIIGTGALAIPKAFAVAGWALSLSMIIIIAFLSYITSTFVIESMSCANALLKIEALKKDEDAGEVCTGTPREENKNLLENASYTESTSLLKAYLGQEQEPFDIKEIFEMGSMAKLYFNKVGYYLFYFCLAIYLYGDLSIYAAAVPKSLRDVTCTYYHNATATTTTVPTTTHHSNSSCTPPSDTDPCWSSSPLTRMDVYRIFVVLFVSLLGSFVFFNLQKTKYLQIITSLLRWLAFFTMVTITVQRLAAKEGRGRPPVAAPSNIPNLFGICVYAFMCHHSLPQLITPIAPKRRVFAYLASTTLLILVFYCLLSLTGVFCFSDLYDLYTLNFQPVKCDAVPSGDVIATSIYIEYFLALFPVFTISTSFPIIGITLRNNLKHILGLHQDSRRSCYRTFLNRLLLPLLVLLVPLSIALLTSDIQFLVGVTGSYAGTFIQYIVPTSLVFLARRSISNLHLDPNPFQSPFKHPVWMFLVLLWSVVCLVVVSVDNVLKI